MKYHLVTIKNLDSGVSSAYECIDLNQVNTLVKEVTSLMPNVEIKVEEVTNFYGSSDS